MNHPIKNASAAVELSLVAKASHITSIPTAQTKDITATPDTDTRAIAAMPIAGPRLNSAVHGPAVTGSASTQELSQVKVEPTIDATTALPR
jgi:hypothetical protein